MTDQIADLLTRIRNGYMAHNDSVVVPFSNQKAKIAEVLSSSGYVGEVKVVDADKISKHLNITLKYVGKYPVISHIERISTPGRRVYSKGLDVKKVLGGNGIRIISTSKGVMIDKEAKLKNLGGEVICKVW